MDEPGNSAEKKTTAQPGDLSSPVSVVVGIGGVIGVALLVLTAVDTVLGNLSRSFDQIHVSVGTFSEGEFWGFYSIYAAVVFYVVPLLDKFSDIIESGKDWLIWIIGAIVCGVTPLIILIRHLTFLNTKNQIADCGSWLTPTPGAVSAPACIERFNSASHLALIIAALGVAAPLIRMAWAVRADGKKETEKGSEGTVTSG